jgi:hypothetical protein
LSRLPGSREARLSTGPPERKFDRGASTLIGAWRVRDGEGKTEEAEDQNGKERAESEAFGTRDVSPWGLMRLSRSNWDLR